MMTIPSTLEGCKGTSEETFIINGQKYRFLPTEVSAKSGVETPDLYLRIIPTGKRYRIIYSNRIEIPNDLGDGVPTIAHINETPNSAAVEKTDKEIVVCKKRKSSLIGKYSCGMNIWDGSSTWSLNFDPADISNSTDIRKDAIIFLNIRRES